MRSIVAARVVMWALAGVLSVCGLASAQPTPGGEEAAPRGAVRYFIEFRSRPSTFIGHTYVVYGRTDAAGRLIEQHYAGLIPDRDAWEGMLAPISARVRKYKDDARYRPNAIYRRRLTAAEYQYVGRVVQFLRVNEREWHAVFQNCNDFGIDIAEALGLRRPPSLMPPSMWVGLLRVLNEP